MTASRIILISLVTALITSVMVAVLKPSATRTGPAKAETLYDRVMRTGTIRCGYTLLEPIMRKDANTGQLSGVTYDLVNKIGEKLSLKIVWTEETGFASMTDGLVSNRYDMVCSAHQVSAARSRVADFTSPVLYIPLPIFVRAGDTRFDHDRAALNARQIVFASIDGTPVPQFIKDFFPKAQLYSLPELSSVAEEFIALKDQKVDALIAPAYEGALFADKHNHAIRPISGPSLFVMPFSFLLPRGQYEFKAMLDSTLEELRTNGTVAALVKKYNRYPGRIYPSRSAHAPVLVE